jgi:hypothetical protein
MKAVYHRLNHEERRIDLKHPQKQRDAFSKLRTSSELASLGKVGTSRSEQFQVSHVGEQPKTESAKNAIPAHRSLQLHRPLWVGSAVSDWSSEDAGACEMTTPLSCGESPELPA